MKTALFFGSGLLMASVLVAACAPQAAPAASPQAAAPAKPAPALAAVVPAPKAPVKAAWELEWEKTVRAAQAEGKLAFGTSAGNEVRRQVPAAFKNQFGIQVESMSGTAGTVMSRLIAERRAGLYLWDVLLAGVSAHISSWKPAGGTSPLEPSLILPDLTDPELIKKVWWDGKLPWVDRDHHVFPGLIYISQAMAINTSMVKPGEIATWDDLLNPKWKGKMLLMDPTQPGTPSDGSLMVMFYEVKGDDWVRKLAAQEPVIVADDRLANDWLAHGKYPIYLAPRPEGVLEFVKAGAPVAPELPKDAMIQTSGVTGVSMVDKAPHPNAARLWINWVLSKEGITLLSRTLERQSPRLDVPTDFLPQEYVRKPGGKYFYVQEEERLFRIEDYRKKSKEIFKLLLK